MTPPPGFGSPFPGAVSAVPVFGSPYVSQPPTGYRMPTPTPPVRPQLAQQQLPAPRVIRGQRPDDPVPTPRSASPIHAAALRMPTPEELGVAPVKRPETVSIDWAAVHDRLDHLGATCFHLERLPQGVCRITCLLPTDQQDRSHRIEALAASEGEAVRLILAKAQELSAGR